MPPRHLGDEIGGDLGRVGKGLVVDPGQPGNQRQGVVGVDVKLVVFRAQVPRHRPGMGGFVKFVFAEADGKGAHGLGALGLHQGHDGGRIDTPGKKGAKRHVGDHAAGHGLAQHRLESIDGLALGEVLAPVGGRYRDGPEVPIAFASRFLPGPHPEQMAGRHFCHTSVDAGGRGYVIPTQEGGQGVALDPARPSVTGQQRFQLGAKEKERAEAAPIEGLDTEAVTDQHQLVVTAVPQSECEHADEALERCLQAPMFDGRQDDLGVAVAAEDHAGGR